MDFDHSDLLAAMRADLSTFIGAAFDIVNPGKEYHGNWHIDAIASVLREIVDGAKQRVLISMPPRYLKSHCCSVAFPAWLLGRDPTNRIICVSYSNDLAADHSRACKTLMQSELYKQAFPGTWIHPRHNTELDFATTRRGRRFATSVHGTLTGLGGNFIIVDDPLKGADAYSEAARRKANEWFDSTLFSRLDSKKDDTILVVMQRLHVDDLIGHLKDKGGFYHLSLPAIAEEPQSIRIDPHTTITRQPGHILHPEREPLGVLEEIKRQIGQAAFNAQYQQRPSPPEGNMIRWAWLKPYDKLPARQSNDIVVQSWDTAAKSGDTNDWSVCTTWFVQGSDYYLVDVHRARLEFPDLKRKVAELAERHQARRILIEETLGGIALVQEVRRSTRHRPTMMKAEGDKQARLYSQTVVMESGQVFIPRSASWLEDFKHEILSFPYGKHDDQVDSLSQFLTWLDRRRGAQPRTRDF